jgi:hypothetical protein
MLPASVPMTAEGTILGTLQYMAPEQLEGKEADGRSDIFSFGAILYEMTTGKRAFEGNSAATVISAIVDRQLPPMSTLQPLTPPILDRVANKCLAKNPDDRWQTAHDLSDELKWIAEHESHAKAGAFQRRPVTRRPTYFAVGGVLIGVVAVTVLALRTFERPLPDRPVVRIALAPARAYRRVRSVGGRVSRRPLVDVPRINGWSSDVVGAPGECAGKSAVGRHRRRQLPVLVARQPLHRILRRRQAENRRRHRIAARPARRRV